MYAVYNRTKDQWLQPFKGGQRRGGTVTEPGPLPRLFTTKTAAGNALRWWLKGEYSVTYDYPNGEDCFLVEHWKPRPDRIAEEWAIISVTIVENN